MSTAAILNHDHGTRYACPPLRRTLKEGATLLLRLRSSFTGRAVKNVSVMHVRAASPYRGAGGGLGSLGSNSLYKPRN